MLAFLLFLNPVQQERVWKPGTTLTFLHFCFFCLFLRFYFKFMSLVNVDEAKQDSEPVERSAGDAAALRGWLQKNLRRSLICHFIFMFYFIAVSKWSNYHELIYPTERLQYSKTCFWLREKSRTSGVWCKNSRCWKCARERCFWLLQLLEHIFQRYVSLLCVFGCARSQHVCSLGKWENYCWRSSFLMDYCSQHQTASAVSVGSVHHDSDLFWTSITASVTNPAETRLAKSMPVKFEWTSSSPPLSQWAWCDHTLTAEVRRKQGSFQQQRRTTAAENMGIVPSRVSRC